MKRICLAVMVFFAPFLWQSQSFCAQHREFSPVLFTPGILVANGEWVSGTIQSIEADGGYRYVRVNDVRYRLMPGIRIDRRVKRVPGAYDEIPVSLRDVREGLAVTLRVQGFRAYQILIME